jgi:hypothetical protein
MNERTRQWDESNGTALRALLGNSLDVALGGYPSAMFEHWNGPEGWCIGDFRILVQDLAGLVDLERGVRGDRPLAICAISPNDGEKWESARERDAIKLNEFLKFEQEYGEICTYSVAIPDLQRAEKNFDELSGFGSANVEVRFPSELEGIEEAVALAAEREYISLAFSLPRSGAIDPLSRCIFECIGLEVPFKILGLSGRAWSDQSELGIVNVLTAAALAFAQDLSPGAISQILCSPRKEEFLFESSGISFREFRASTDQVAEARSIFEGVEVADIERAIGERAYPRP